MNIEETLKAAGYAYDHARMSWFNRSARKIFSEDVLRDHDLNWLRLQFSEPVPTDQFWFYFNSAPTDPSVCVDVLRQLRLSELAPVVKARS